MAGSWFHNVNWMGDFREFLKNTSRRVRDLGFWQKYNSPNAFKIQFLKIKISVKFDFLALKIEMTENSKFF
jgi:hypothetical protein